MYAVIRLRGCVHVRQDIAKTLELLRLHRKMHCVILPENNVMKGMIRKAKDYITWGEISDEMLYKLVAKRGRKPGNNRLNENEVKAAIEEIKSGKIKSIKPVFRLTPPSGGFKKSIKYSIPKGELGYRGAAINDLLERMI
jgi:large subunit ribosomal protein L30